jgi:undecaprenyl-diphosphatase
MSPLQAVILAVVEGLTEYLPVSSTGHLIISSALMGINEQPFTKDYTVIVQFGAILSVLVLYWRKFLSGVSFYKKLIVGFLPAAILGLSVKSHIDALLGNVWVVAIALILGGVVLLVLDRIFDPKRESQDLDSLTYRQSALIGVFQCLAFVPGVSRAAATIVGGLSQKLSRRSAAEFSFYLAVPTLTGATCLKLMKVMKTIQPDQIDILLIGNLISFIVGILTIRMFIGYLVSKGLKMFGYYRIILGVSLLILLATGHSLKVL